MNHQKLFVEVPNSIETSFRILSELSDELSNGKGWKNILNLRGTFEESGSWWVRNRNGANHTIDLMWKRFDTYTIYVAVSLISLNSGGTIAIFEARRRGVFDFFGTIKKPVEIITTLFRERTEQAEKVKILV